MPINVFGNSSNDNNNKIDTSLFVQKPYLRHNYIESNIEDIDLKNQYKIKNLHNVDNAISVGVNEQSLLRLDPDEKLEQDSIILNSTLTSSKTIIEVPTKNYVDNKYNYPSIIKNTDHADFNDKYLDNVRWIRVNELPQLPNDLVPKFHLDEAIHNIYGYVDSLHENSRNK